MREVLRGWFTQWGLPDELRFDNGAPWGGWNDLPPDLALWLLGLAIGLIWNRPHHKQGNAVIERAHGVCQRWVEADRCADAAAVQAHLDWATTRQRERYPAVNGQSRLAAYPALATGGRPYDPAREADLWDERRVWGWLGERVGHRRVDKAGQISLAGRARGVGKAWVGQDVSVRLVVEAGGPVWRISDRQGTLLRQHPAPELARERILALDVSHHRPRRRHRAKPSVRHEA
jgi:hypothetical protein